MGALAPQPENAAEDSILVLSRRLALAPDPLGIYGAARRERSGPSALFETADAGAKKQAESLIFLDACASLEARGREVKFRPRGPLGRVVDTNLARQLRLRSMTDDAGARCFASPAPAAETGEEIARLRSASALDPLRALAFGLGAGAFAFGGFAYDLLDAFEDLPNADTDPTAWPDYTFHLAASVIRVDHRHARTTLSVLADAADPTAGRRRLSELAELCLQAEKMPATAAPRVAARCTQTDAEYAQTVARCKAHIAAGDVFQIVPSRAWEAPCADPLAAYARLRAANPSPYMFCLDDPAGTLFGASPESALKVDAASRRVELRPIAGTRRRGADPEDDARLELELRLSEKEVAEHVMLVDLARNDVARIAAPGTRRVSELMQVERYSHVMHLVSRVEGRLAPDLDALHAYRATLNMGTLTGAPKLRAAQLLRRFEPARRGPYGGAVGYLTGAGDLDTAIVIRSALVRDGIARVQAGAGVVADSDPMAEADETRRKAQAVLGALGASEEAADE